MSVVSLLVSWKKNPSESEAAIFEVSQGHPPFALLKLTREKCRCLAMHLDQSAALLILAALLRRPLARRWNWNPALFGDHAHGFGKAGVLELHHKLKNVSAHAASETVVNLANRMHCKGRRFFVMKRAQSGEILAGFFQAQVFANHANDIRLLLHLLRE